MTDELQQEGEEQPHLLLVDDDPTFTREMARAMSRRGLQVSIAGSAEEGLALAKQDVPDYAVLDLKMEGDSGLVLLPKLLELDPEMRVLILTGYSSIATAVETEDAPLERSTGTWFILRRIQPRTGTSNTDCFAMKRTSRLPRICGPTPISAKSRYPVWLPAIRAPPVAGMFSAPTTVTSMRSACRMRRIAAMLRW